MKGYLQRMAASVMNPQRSVQPLLGTLFSGARPESEAVPGVWPELSTEIPAEPEALRTKQKVDPPAARLTPPDERDQPESPTTQKISGASRMSGRQVEFPDRGFEPLVASPAILRAGDPPQHPARLETETQTETQTETRTEMQVRVDTRPVILPISQVREHRDSAIREPRAHRSAPAQPDEVHIHIGRIEVTAVPPPAPPAIQKPARKSLNLTEYLRRSR
jgi:hypothetical protein